ncbi:hypothetical protein OFC17_30470 [Escherichia coli]|nr:hypothetical protein [Escherichia coli]
MATEAKQSDDGQHRRGRLRERKDGAGTIDVCSVSPNAGSRVARDDEEVASPGEQSVAET